jgi:hypothetical protein
MAANLYPLVYKAGIKRDGTTFQPEYCTEGQWVRFQHGKICKMGGMFGFASNPIGADYTYLRLFPQDDNKMLMIVAGPWHIYPIILDQNFNSKLLQSWYSSPIRGNGKYQILWQAAVVIYNAKQYMVFMGAPILQDITQNTPSIYTTWELGNEKQPFTSSNHLDPTAKQASDIKNNANLNGGLCYSNPYLFFYGSNGMVQYSRSENPFSFEGGDSGTLSLGSDKVIYGTPVRGGSNAPSLLFWTMSSVVRVINTGTDKVDFHVDVISKSSSIISTRCVVEYDGLFFWPGTDRFFVYNGVVQEMSNNTNLDYFFDNVDLTYRQKIFGIEQPLYGEIWWFYPEKMNAKGRDQSIPQGENTRAIIYNKRENSWYDTAISREAGTFCDELGIIMTYGRPLVKTQNPDADKSRFWIHEKGTVQESRYYSNDLIQPSIFLNIPSYIKLPTISWAAFNPGGQNDQNGQGNQSSKGVDRWVSLKRFEPDFIMSDPDDEMQITVNSKEYAQSVEALNITLPFTGRTEKLDFITQGRHITLTFTFNGKSAVEMGQCLLLLGAGDKR